MNPSDDFNIHFPYRRGDFNIHSGPGGSITAVLANLETIWTHVLENNLHIRNRDLKFYKAVLIIPDVYNRSYLRELMTLLLIKIGFGACFLVQVCLYKMDIIKRSSRTPKNLQKNMFNKFSNYYNK